MFPFRFPYTNFHELNLDWILETIQSNTDRIVNTLNPVGSIYISTDSESPASLFGGVWEQLKDRFLLGAGGRYIAGGRAGEEAHTLTVDEMPSHKHIIYMGSEASSGEFWGPKAIGPQSKEVSNNTDTSGGNQPHNNMPPYLAVYMWKRVS